MRTTNTGHILQADLLCTAFDQLLRKVDIILSIMHFRIGDTHRGLRRHARFLRPFDGRDDITRVIQTAEDTSDIRALCVLHFVHQLTHIRRNRVHTQRVQTTVQHMGLDTRLVEGFTEGTNRQVRVLAIQ